MSTIIGTAWHPTVYTACVWCCYRFEHTLSRCPQCNDDQGWHRSESSYYYPPGHHYHGPMRFCRASYIAILITCIGCTRNLSRGSPLPCLAHEDDAPDDDLIRDMYTQRKNATTPEHHAYLERVRSADRALADYLDATGRA